MKKIISLIITVALLLPAFAGYAAVGDDYQTHWSFEYIRFLREKDIVSGDTKGNMNPENPITRAEFAQVTNNAFNYTEKSEAGFSDVAENKWYFNAMSIALKAGYFKGDEKGNGNPEKYITRAEAATAFARIINAYDENAELSFKDSASVPGWAKPHISALYKKGIIKGYSDGSYNPYGNMKRAEYFTIVAKHLSEVYKEPVKDEEKENNFTTDVITDKSPSYVSGGGGGGGGGIPPVSQTNTITEISYDEYTGLLSWDGAKNANYTISVEHNTSSDSQTVQASTNKYNIAYIIQALLEGKTKTEKEYFTVSVTTDDGAGKTTSIYLETPFIEFPQIQLEQNIAADGTETMKLYWTPSANAASYAVKLVWEDGSENTLTVNDNKEADISLYLDLITGREKLKVSVASANTADYLSVEDAEIEYPLPLFDGFETNPYKISTKRHFNNIAKMQENKFVLTQDIDLGTHTPLTLAKGATIDGQNFAVTVNIANGTNANTGIFAEVGGTVDIKNLKIKGSVAGGQYTGALIGNVKAASGISVKVTNVINYASVNGGNATGIGGIIGYSFNVSYITPSALIVSKCINYGKIDGGQATGGIVGQTSGQLKYCGNTGTVTIASGKHSVGGIAGMLYGTVSYSYNSGKVAGSDYTGGIAGQISYSTEPVTNCYNSGEVSGRAVSTGGILGYVNTNRNLENCYNIYNVLPAERGVLGSVKAGRASVITNSYTAEAEGEALEGVTEKSLEFFKSVPSGFDSAEWCIDYENTLYEYAQLVKLPHKFAIVELTAPALINTPSNTGEASITFKFEGDARAEKLHIIITSEDSQVIYDEEIEAPELVDGKYTLELPIENNLVEGKKYVISAKCLGDNIITADSSAMQEVIYEHAGYRLSYAKLSGISWAHDSSTEKYTVSFELEKDDPLFAKYRVTLYESDKTTQVGEPSEILKPTSGTKVSYDVTPTTVQLGSGVMYLKVETMGSTPEITGTPSSDNYIPVDLKFAGTDDENNTLIANERHFTNIGKSEETKAGKYKLLNDLTLSADFAPFAFAGIFDGGNKSITIAFADKYEYMTTSNGNKYGICSGLFTYLYNNGTNDTIIKNVGVKGSISASSVTGIYNVGGIAGAIGCENNSVSQTGDIIIENCVSEVDINCRSNYHGGIIGETSKRALAGKTVTISKCSYSSDVPIVGYTYKGGIAGYAGDTTTISQCVNYTAIPNTSGSSGGIVGGTKGNVKECANYGKITAGASGIAGGIIGEYEGGNTILSDLHNAGEISSTSGKSGGIIGNVNAAVTLTNAYNSGICPAGREVVGTASKPITYTNCYYLTTTATNTQPQGVTSADDVDFGTSTVWEKVNNNWKLKNIPAQ